MSNELQIIDETVISSEVKAEINEDIDRIIASHKNNRQAINKLVFESVAAMTEADDAQAELSNKGWLQRRIGSITGSNSRLQDRINSNRSTAMYASQQTLQKLAEQNLMTFDLIAAVNNKLNASLLKVDAEFANVYQVLGKFFKDSRSELARLEARVEKMERNISLLNWQNSIEYQVFDGMEYVDLDDVSKIVCLVRDFYDITKGEWSNSDLLLLKSAMRDIDISPKDNVNYFEVLKVISYNENLKAHMLDSRTIEPIDDPSYLLSLGCLKKYETLNDEESYMVDTVVEHMNSMGVKVGRNSVCDQMTAKYLETKAFVNVDVDVECYDLILELLYNIRQAKDENLLVGGMIPEVNAEELFNLGLAYLNGDGVEQSDTQAYDYFQQAANLGDSDALGILGRCYEDGIGVEQDFSMAMELYLKSADLGNDIAMNDIGDLYYFGSGVVQDYAKALEWYLKAADYDNEYALNNLGILYADGLGVERDYIKAFEWWEKAAGQDNARAMNNIGDLYANGWGVEQDYDKALEWFQKAADLGHEDALGNIERVVQEKAVLRERVLKEAMEQYKLGLGAFERKEYQKAEGYFIEALNKGVIDASFRLAETYYRNDRFNICDDKNKIEYVDFDGQKKSVCLGRNDYAILYILRAAIAGNKRAIIEFYGWVVLNAGECRLHDLILYGLIDDIKEGFFINETKFVVSKESLGTSLGVTWYQYKISGIKDWAYANLLEAAQAGDGAAQYYVGAYYTRKYDLSCSSEHQSKAKHWLAKSEGKVNAPNVYKLTKYLNKFIAFGDCPEIDYFV